MINKLLKFVGWITLIAILVFVVQSQLIITTVVENQNILQERQDRTLLILNQQVQQLNKKIKQIDYNTSIINQTMKKPSFEYLKSVTVAIQGVINEPKVKEQPKKPQTNGVPVLYRDVKEGWIGTGVVVKITEDFTYVLTNKHVAGVGRTNSTISILNSIQTKQATIMKFHPYLDLAIIRVDGRLEGKLAIKGVSISFPQDKVYLVGHHLGRKYIYGEGVFAGYDRIYDVIQIPCLYGNSGSGVFDKEGKLTSLIFAITVIPSKGIFPIVDVAHGIAINGISLKIFLKEYVE